MMDAKDDLLTTLLNCGTRDLDKLVEILDMGNELFDDNILADVIDEYGTYTTSGCIKFNELMLRLMETIAFKLADDFDLKSLYEDHYYRKTLEEYWGGPFTNYLDSHFNLNSLDEWDGKSKDEMFEQLKKEIPTLREELIS
jgi:hypothetical protein